MQRWDGIEAIPASLQATVVTIGNFDGVHRGHAAVVDAAVRAARSYEATAVALTFHPHPAHVHRRESAPELLTGLSDKLDLLAEQGLDATLVAEYTLEFAQQDPETFVRRYLVDALKVRAVVVGADVRFGRDNAGDRDTMAELGLKYGFDVHLVHDAADPGQRRWSSTWVRELLAAGNVEAAADVLGRPHRMRGEVVRGHARGRDLGFPTANLHTDATGAVPADGVYAGWLVRRPGTSGEHRLPAAISVGTNPTFDGLLRQVEAHVLGRWDLDLYHEEVVVEFTHLLRPTIRFDDVDALVRQMRQDVRDAAARLGVPEPADPTPEQLHTPGS
ncbi:MAG TPA: bifunctional riboflavin kinase/FAD synthetase [Beutenbergiaceae bacterium]|nr:bifunctional riboflavin kinase/FAD synthetase [Beutenbergiaceae bacterium]